MSVTLTALVAIFILAVAAAAIGIDWLVDKRFSQFTEDEDET